MLTIVSDSAGRESSSSGSSVIDKLVREGARRMLAEALQAEVDAYIARFAGDRDQKGHRLVVAQRLAQAARGTHQRGRCRSAGSRGSTTSASTRIPLSGSGSPRRSCRHQDVVSERPPLGGTFPLRAWLLNGCENLHPLPTGARFNSPTPNAAIRHAHLHSIHGRSR